MKQQKRLYEQKTGALLCSVFLFSSVLLLTSCNGLPQSGQGDKAQHQAVTLTPAAFKTPVTTGTTIENQKTVEAEVENSSQGPRMTIERVLSLRAICHEKKLKWSSIEVVDTLETGTVQCMVTADERLSAFSPLILYAHGPIELRKVKKGREFYFSQTTVPKKLRAPSSLETAEFFQKIRKMLKKEIPEAKTKLAISGDESNSSALRISSLHPMELLDFINTVDAHIYSITLNRDERETESIIVELEAVVGKTKH